MSDTQPTAAPADLADIVEIAAEHRTTITNELLAHGWRLLAVGVDEHGFPALIIGRPAAVAWTYEQCAETIKERDDADPF